MKNRHVLSKVLLISTTLVLFMAGCTLPGFDPVCPRGEFIVTRTDDTSSGYCAESSCSLRQAIMASNVCSGLQTVRIPTGTYTLTTPGRDEDGNLTGDLDIRDSVNIIGVGMPAIDGHATDRVFDIHPGATVGMTGLVIQNGQGSTGGQGIRNRGDLTASQVSIQNNRSITGFGETGGVQNEGRASFSHSAIVNNVSMDEVYTAGGLLNSGQLFLDNVTVSDNQGCGIMNTATGNIEVSYSTFADNMSGCQIWNFGSTPSTIKINNSIVASHTAGESNCRGLFSSGGFNLGTSGSTDPGNCGFNQASDINLVNPQLGPLLILANMPPVRPIVSVDSLALDTADSDHCGGTDQRGMTRPQGRSCDRGAYEFEAVGMHLEAGTPVGIITLLPPEIPSVIILVPLQPVNCRQGPDVAYPILDSVEAGLEVQVVARNEQSTWWYVQLENDNCWISNVAGIPQGNVDSLPIKEEAPPIKEEVAPPTATLVPTAILDPDYDLDGYPASMDCNDKDSKINPGAVETPNDKVDSNCNGDDDK